MRVAAVQFKPTPGDLAASRDRLVALAREAAEGADLVVLPEMAATGYVFPDEAAAAAVAEDPSGPTFQALSEVAREAGCWIVCGFAERAPRGLYNAAMVIDARGGLAFTYRKTLLFELDRAWARPGDSGYAVHDTGAGTFTVGICMDMNDDAFVAWCHRAAPRVVAFPTNWIEEGLRIWPYWAWRLAETPCALVAANTWGAEGPIRFHGRSAILDGFTLHAGGPAEGDAILRARLPERRP